MMLCVMTVFGTVFATARSDTIRVPRIWLLRSLQYARVAPSWVRPSINSTISAPHCSRNQKIHYSCCSIFIFPFPSFYFSTWPGCSSSGWAHHHSTVRIFIVIIRLTIYYNYCIPQWILLTFSSADRRFVFAFVYFING